ncbi:MAG: DNA translocase FtsK 4TM domain-containing protein, partial [Prevotella sp.]
MARKKTSRKSKNFSEATGFKYIFENETSNFFLGLIILAIAVYIIIAMASFLSTAQVDQSMLENMRPGEWLNQNKEFTNYCGSLGAILSYYLMTVNFGLPAFLIPLFLILVALKLTRAYHVNLWKWFLGTALVMVWSSVTFAKFLTPLMSNMVFNPGGNHGVFCVKQLENMIGPPGLTAILLIVALAFLTYLSAETIEIIRKALNPVKYITNKVKFTVTNHASKDEGTEQIEVEEVIDDEEEELPTVVDLTDMTQGQSPIIPPRGGQLNESDDKPLPVVESELVVDKVQQEAKASGNGTTAEERLSVPINPWEPFTNYRFPNCDLLKKYNSKPVIDMEE